MTPKQIKAAAHSKVETAIASGRLKRGTICETCGKISNRARNIHAHHDDYTKPLDVRWLCGSCHKRHHLALKTEGMSLREVA